MPAASYQPDLDHLLHISHVLGCNERFAQAGGGNTSVKCSDGRTMLIKASGTPLSGLSPSVGWVAVDMQAIQTLFHKPQLRKLPDAQREEQVLGVLYGAVVEPKDARPSVETPLHVLLDRVVMHGHPVAANALSCHRDGERLLPAVLAGVGERPALWVPYVDPGSTLAFALADIIERYRAGHGGPPDVLLLQNHGLFVAAGSATECVLKHQLVIERIEKWLAQRMPAVVDAQLADRVREAVSKACGTATLVRFCADPRLVRAARGSLAAVFEQALTPDHVVYTGPCALIAAAAQSAENLAAAISAFRAKHGAQPRLILLKGACLCILGESQKRLDAAEALALSAVEIAELTAADIRFLTPKDVSFIMNWEAEHYRAKQ